jgi:small subunit ribosomal protein S4
MRYTGPKNRISRREGMDLELKTAGSKSQASLLKKINVLPGQHGLRGRRKVSEYGKQLREKQKLRFMFGLTEKKLKSYFMKAAKKTGNTGLNLSQSLEKRLDTVVHRLGFAPTRAAARQLITHKHMKVNEQIVNVPSYQVRTNDVITFAKETSQKIPFIEQSLARNDILYPLWLKRDGMQGTLIEEPTAERLEKQINLRLVIEFYSK